MQISTRARSNTLVPTLLVLALLAIVPLLPLGARTEYVLAVGLVYAIAAVGLDPFSGYTGQLTFGNFGFVAIGAYVSAILATDYGWNPWQTLPVAVIACGVVGFVLGSAMVRLPHLGTAMGTIFFAYVVLVALRGDILEPWTHGAIGIPVQKVTVAGIPATGAALYWLAWAVLLVVTAVTYLYVNSRAGNVLRLIKRSEVVAASMGVDVFRHKRAAFVFSAMAAGAAGFVYAQAVEYLIPDNFVSFESILLLTMAIVGGLGSVAGPIVGAILFMIVTEATRSVGDLRHVIFALMLLAGLIFIPDGIYGVLEKYVNRLLPRSGRGKGGAGSASGIAEGAAPPRTERSPGLSIRSVGVNYGGVVALQDIGIEVAPGSIHAIIGPNGAGKTTLLNCVSGLQRSSGGIFLDDVEIGRFSPGEIRRLGVSRTFQNPALVPDLSVVENVQLGLYGDQPSASWRDVLPVPAIGRRDAASLAAAHAVLDLMKFPVDRRLVLASDLSLAEQKLTDIARAIAGHTRVLLLDEPTAGLSDDEIGIVAEALKVINRTSGITMLVIAHHVGFLRRIADQATVLNFGRVIARGTPEEVARDKLVLDVFLGESDGQ